MLRFRDVDTGDEDHPYTSLFTQILPSLPPETPSSCRPLDEHRTCFFAGDDRVNQHPLLTAVHTIFLRYHNMVAEFLSSSATDFGEEIIFQEVRKFVIAVYQVVIYKEFLPALLGHLDTEESKRVPHLPHRLELIGKGYFAGYDDSKDPHVFNEYAAAAFRYELADQWK